MANEWLEKARRLDFDALDMKVSERIAALRLYVQSIDKAAEEPAVHDAICRDLIFPAVMHLAHFIEAVNVGQASDADV